MTDLTPQIVKIARVGLGLSQAEFAQKCGLGKNTLPRIERSEGRANDGTWRLIEVFLREQGVSWLEQSGIISIQLPTDSCQLTQLNILFIKRPAEEISRTFSMFGQLPNGKASKLSLFQV